MSEQDFLNDFQELVEGRFQKYNKLFLELPFDNVESIGKSLMNFGEICAEKLEQGLSPRQIIEEYIAQFEGSGLDRFDILFKVLQFVERQVALFDAIEDGSFDRTRDLDGHGTLTDLLTRAREAGKLSELKEILQDYKVKIVLTAHPTQFYPASILGIIDDLIAAVREDNEAALRELLLQMGKTSFENKSKPTPVQEAERLIWYLEKVFYNALPAIQEEIHKELDTEYTLPALMEIGFWPGGDRDGNPYVTAETTYEVSMLLRQSILRQYIYNIRSLKKRLTFADLGERLDQLEDILTEANYNPDSEVFHSYTAEHFLSDLHEIKSALENSHQGLFVDKVNLLIIRVKLFGFNFAALDLRQDSGVHKKALAELSTNDPGEITQLSNETIETFKVARHIQELNGINAIKSYIISHTEELDDILNVIKLAELSGWNRSELNFDIVPLFETIGDLQNAPEIMRSLYQSADYQAHLARRGNRQVVMLGFSDGTKDGGYITANWSIYLAKRNLSKLAQEFGIKIVFFDGRGGPPARGGGDTRSFYLAQGPCISQHEIMLTIQGQTISSTFGTTMSAQYNYEELFTAVLDHKLFPNDNYEIKSEEDALIQELSEIAHQHYQGLRNHELFLDYLEEVTPLPFYKKLNIASRPARRSQGRKKLSLSDLRAIPFVSSWTHMRQNIPAFYGVGHALNTLIEQGKKEALQNLYNSCLFFRSLINNSMQSLTKGFFPMTYYLRDDQKYSPFWNILHQEAELTERLVKEVSGQEKLLEGNPIGKRSIRIRAMNVLPILTIQHYAMQILREMSETDSLSNLADESDIHAKLILKALPATVNASRNSV